LDIGRHLLQIPATYVPSTPTGVPDYIPSATNDGYIYRLLFGHRHKTLSSFSVFRFRLSAVYKHR